jgi:hypothetical protein
MTIAQMTITKNSEDNYEFFYNKRQGARIRSVDDERIEIVRFVDDAIDIILRLKNKLTGFPCGKYMTRNRVLFEAGNDLLEDNLKPEE